MKKIDELIEQYTYRVWKEDKFVATCAELPSMSAFGNTKEEALRELESALRVALEWMEDEREELPEPLQRRRYKGKISLRLTPETHRRVALHAAEEGVSVNRYISSRLT